MVYSVGWTMVMLRIVEHQTWFIFLSITWLYVRDLSCSRLMTLKHNRPLIYGTSHLHCPIGVLCLYPRYTPTFDDVGGTTQPLTAHIYWELCRRGREGKRENAKPRLPFTLVATKGEEPGSLPSARVSTRNSHTESGPRAPCWKFLAWTHWARIELGNISIFGGIVLKQSRSLDWWKEPQASEECAH